jgi:N-acetylneuraminate synthase
MLKKLELTENDFIDLFSYSEKHNIKFLSTPFDTDSLDFLVSNRLIDRVKIPSGEITNIPFLVEIGRRKLPIILSTGMANMAEVELALAALAFSLLSKGEKMCQERFYQAYYSNCGIEVLQKYVTILHCTTEYPALPESINLKALRTLSNAFALPVGLSDHSKGIHIPLAAVALDATIIEKHFTSDRTLPGPDHKASLLPDELKEMVRQIREIEASMGNGRKVPVDIEIKNRIAARKRLVALKDLNKGDIFTPENLGVLRGGDGAEPIQYWHFINRQAPKNFKAGEGISLEQSL